MSVKVFKQGMVITFGIGRVPIVVEQTMRNGEDCEEMSLEKNGHGTYRMCIT